MPYLLCALLSAILISQPPAKDDKKGSKGKESAKGGKGGKESSGGGKAKKKVAFIFD